MASKDDGMDWAHVCSVNHPCKNTMQVLQLLLL
jgi:hypothetical protein